MIIELALSPQRVPDRAPIVKRGGGGRTGIYSSFCGKMEKMEEIDRHRKHFRHIPKSHFTWEGREGRGVPQPVGPGREKCTNPPIESSFLGCI